MSATLIGTAQDALYEALVAETTLSGLVSKKQISLGWPENQPQLEHIWITGSVPTWEIGPPELDMAEERIESFDLQVNVLVAKKSGGFTAVRDRMLALIEGIREPLRDDHTLSGAVLDAAITGGVWNESVTQDGRQLEVNLTVQVRTVVD